MSLQFLGYHKHVKDAWVPLKIKEQTGTPKTEKIYNHIELLERLTTGCTSNVALVKGHPGAGKTTLVKRIAYDWATGNLKTFRVVLVVPLRYVQSTEDFLQLAVDYYTNQIGLPSGTNIELISLLRRLGPQLLVCLDGLDEYRGVSESVPLKVFSQQNFDVPAL